jgi:glucokinase
VAALDYALGIDLGGTNLRFAAFRPDGRLVDKIGIPTNIGAGRDALVDSIVAGIRQIRDARGDERLLGIGIGVPGFILLEKGIITKSPNLPGLENFPMRDELQARLGSPVVLENDANAAALGEKWMGAGREVEDLVLLTLGTGIGGGIISGGKVLHGYLGMAGELGHLTVEPHDDTPCGCGATGCLEVHASATAISRLAREAGLGLLTSAAVYDRAMNGDMAARKIFWRMGQALGRGLALLINTFNFPLYLLSGGVLAAWDLFAPAMYDECRRRSLTFRQTDTRIDRAALGDEAGLYGAARLVL